MKRRISTRKRPGTRRYEAPLLVDAGRLVPSTRGANKVTWPEDDTTGELPFYPQLAL